MFFGRIHPDKGTKEAIDAARASGRALDLYGIVQDEGLSRPRDRAPRSAPTSATTVQSVGPTASARSAPRARFSTSSTSTNRFGLSVVEAMACGTPAIANRRGSMPELIEHGVTGFLVDTPEEALTAIERAGDLDRATVRRHAVERFGVDRMADEYLALYRRILAG